MCGIVGYIGQGKAYPVLIEGLKKLEYRGYDSAGVALVSDINKLNVYKTKGKVSNLEAMVPTRIAVDISESPILVGQLMVSHQLQMPTLIRA